MGVTSLIFKTLQNNTKNEKNNNVIEFNKIKQEKIDLTSFK